MNDLKTFHSDEFGNVRTLTIEDEPWFVGKDVAEILGYSNSRKAIADHVDEEDKGVTKRDTLGGQQEMAVINESGLYSLILSSKLPSAKRFKRWVTTEVLPAIRKHGVYGIDEVLNDPDMLISALQALKKERKANESLHRELLLQDEQIAEMEPKACYYDQVLSCPDALPVTTIAKDYGFSAKRLNQILCELGIQYRLQDTWYLYSEYADKGYTSSKTFVHTGKDGELHSTVHTYWTQLGRLFIYEKLKKLGILPLIEMDIDMEE